ncbi:hypothetical protein [Piscirickettsia salmonis]|uniref:hypothetical protein n=1 Tax=Piscirickettsia salmonis TaxID=1238 RepID=UPI0007C8EE81|nr:hypothetical protein A0O36_00856 [Piscirickettsiaceae bacterium NZ-RLO1]
MTVNKLYKQLITDLRHYSSNSQKKPIPLRINLGTNKHNKLAGRHLTAKYLARKFEDHRTYLDPKVLNQQINPFCKNHTKILMGLIIDIKKQKNNLGKYKHKTMRSILTINIDRINAMIIHK